MGETEGLRPSVDPLFKAAGNQDPLVMFSCKQVWASSFSGYSALPCTSTGQEGEQRGTEVNGSLVEARTGSLRAGVPYSSKRSRRAQPLPRPLVPAEGRQSLCPTTQGKLSQRAPLFSSQLEAGGQGRASQEEPRSVCIESWSLPFRAQCCWLSHFWRM